METTLVETRSASRERRVRLTAAQAIVRFLQAQWSERDGERRRVIAGVFGIYGHGNVCGLGEALEQDGVDIPYHQGKNEQSMVHTAIGYAKASNRLSTLACTASIGPGCTNLVSGAATATVNRIPVLLLAADTFASRLQGPVLQQLEHPLGADVSVNDCFRPVSRFFDRIARPEQVLAALPAAIRVLLDPAETGAVTISMHQDAEGEAYDYPESFFQPRVWQVARRPPALEEIEAAATVIRESRRPLIIAGGGVRYSGAAQELLDFSERFNVPIAETHAGTGVTSQARLCLGGLGVHGSAAANEIAADADVVLCVGTRLTDFTTASQSLFQHPDVRFVGINVCSADAYKMGATPVVADARSAVHALGRVLGDSGWSAESSLRESVETASRTWEQRLTDDLMPREDERMSQGQVVRAVSNAAQAGDIVVAASGTPVSDTVKLWDCSKSTTALLEFGYSCMGHEVPSAIGVRMASSEAGEVYALVGDGTYLMGGTSELVTAIQEGLKVTVVVMENGGHQSIRALQARTTGGTNGTEFRRRSAATQLTGEVVAVDFAANARSLGCAAFDVESLEDLETALEAGRRETRPTVIVAHVEPQRLTLGSGSWWDVGFAETSERPEVQEAAAEHLRGAELQRFYY